MFLTIRSRVGKQLSTGLTVAFIALGLIGTGHAHAQPIETTETSITDNCYVQRLRQPPELRAVYKCRFHRTWPSAAQ